MITDCRVSWGDRSTPTFGDPPWLTAWSLYAGANYTGSTYIDHVPGDGSGQLMVEKTGGYLLVDAKLGKKLAESVTAYAGAKNVLGYTQPTRDNPDAAYVCAPSVPLWFDLCGYGDLRPSRGRACCSTRGP